MTAKEQNKLAGIFLMIHGGLYALIMLFVAVIYGLIGAGIFATARRDEEQVVGLVFIGMIVFVSLLTLLFVVPQIVGGWKLIKETPNARIWGIIGSITACVSFPLGTAAGVYGLVFLLGDEGKRFYLGGNSYQQNTFQPPPNYWQ
jgi:hypothetical protein